MTEVKETLSVIDRVRDDLDLTAPIRTRDGRAVRLISTTDTHKMGPYNYPLRAEVERPNDPGGWTAWHYMRDGRWKSNDPCNGNDLVNVRRAGMQ